MTNAASDEGMSESIGLLLHDSLRQASIDQMILEVILCKSQILLAKQGSYELLGTSISWLIER